MCLVLGRQSKSQTVIVYYTGTDAVSKSVCFKYCADGWNRNRLHKTGPPKQRKPNCYLALTWQNHIIGGSCHKYDICGDKTRLLCWQKYACRDKHVFVATKHLFCHDKCTLAAKKVLFYRDKIMFGLTNICRDKNIFCIDRLLAGILVENKRQTVRLLVSVQEWILTGDLILTSTRLIYCSACMLQS